MVLIYLFVSYFSCTALHWHLLSFILFSILLFFLIFPSHISFMPWWMDTTHPIQSFNNLFVLEGSVWERLSSFLKPQRHGHFYFLAITINFYWYHISLILWVVRYDFWPCQIRQKSRSPHVQVKEFHISWKSQRVGSKATAVAYLLENNTYLWVNRAC